MSARKKKTATPATRKTSTASTRKRATTSRLVWWEAITLSLGTSGKSTFSVDDVTALDREWRLDTVNGLSRIMVKPLSKNSKRGGGKSTR